MKEYAVWADHYLSNMAVPQFQNNAFVKEQDKRYFTLSELLVAGWEVIATGIIPHSSYGGSITAHYHFLLGRDIPGSVPETQEEMGLRQALDRKARIKVCPKCGQDPYDGHGMCWGRVS